MHKQIMFKKIFTRILSIVAIFTLAVNTVSASTLQSNNITKWFGLVVIGVPTAIWIYMIITTKKK